MTDLLRSLDPGPAAMGMALRVALQVAGLVAAAALASALACRRRASARHAVWLWCLALVVASPMIGRAADRLGLVLARVPLAIAEVPTPRTPSAWALDPVGGQDSRAEGVREERASAIPPAAGPSPVVLSGIEPIERLSPGAVAFPLEDGVRGFGDRPVGPPPGGPGMRAGPAPSSNAATDPGPSPGVGGIVRGVVMLVWVAGVGLGLARIAAGLAWVAALGRTLRPVGVDRLRGIGDEVREAVGLRGLPPIATSAAVAGPAAVGLLRPRVVLPEGMPEAVGDRVLRDVLIHECAHVARRDHLVGLLQRLAGAVYWPHPMVHLLNARLSRAREECCDDLVLARGDAVGYARTLLELSERRPRWGAARPGIGMFGPRWTLTDRISGILDRRRSPMAGSSPWTVGVAALALAATGVAIAGVRPEGPARESDVAVPARDPEGEPAPPADSYEIRGIVVDGEGRPVADAVVAPLRWFKARGGTTSAADGTFRLRLVGHRLRSEELIARTADGGQQGLVTFIEPTDGSDPEPLRITLAPARLASVRVVDGEGRPVAGAAVEVIAGHASMAVGETDASGLAALHYPDGVNVEWVLALKPGVGFDAFENFDAWPSDGRPAVPEGATLVLDGATAARVLAVDGEGEPLAGVPLSPWLLRTSGKIADANIGGSRIAGATTDVSGVAAFDWLPTDLVEAPTLLVLPLDYDLPGHPVLTPTPAEVDLTVRPLRLTRLSGAVRMPDGSPASGILVHASGTGPGWRSSFADARTGPDGAFSVLAAPEQSYMVTVRDDRLAARSLTGVVLREGEPVEGLDLRLGPGALVRGRITAGPDDRPVPGEHVALMELGDMLADHWAEAGEDGDRERLYHRTTTDDQGRYALRVGPGTYRLILPHGESRETIELETGDEVVRDARIGDETEQQDAIAGMVVDLTGPGRRPVPGALVEVFGLDRRMRRRSIRAGDDGRFEAVGSGGDLLVFARSPGGDLAGTTSVGAGPGPGELLLGLGPAASASGRLVDAAGRPLAGRRVRLFLDSDDGRRSFALPHLAATADAEGRFSIGGLPVGSRLTAYVQGDSERDESRITTIEVAGPGVIELPDLVVGDAGRDPVPTEARRTGVPPAEADVPRDDRGGGPIFPTAPTRDQVRALVEAIGRDEATPGLVDRAWVRFRPQYAWTVDLDRLRLLVTDAAFVARVDAASRAATGRPSDSLRLLELARGYVVGQDDALLASTIAQRAAEATADVLPIRGVVVEGEAGAPVAGAVVYTEDAVGRTDAAGRFEIAPEVAPRRGRVWVEADGYALAEHDATGARDRRIVLVREAPISGRVVGPGGGPVEGAIVRAMVNHQRFNPSGDGPRRSDSYGFPVSAVTDAGGRFVFRGMPPAVELGADGIDHPTLRPAEGQGARLVAGTEATLRMEPGCSVAGTVVDEQGRPVPGAWASLRAPSSLGHRHEAHTDAHGRFRFDNVAPGPWVAVVQPEGLAPAIEPVFAALGRPAEEQFIAARGASIAGRVVGPDGEPVAGAAVGWVVPVDAGGRLAEGRELQLMTRSEPDGTFRLGPLEPGRYRLTALAEEPRRLGRSHGETGRADLEIRIEPDPIP